MLAVALPLILGAAVLVLRVGASQELARTCVRTLRVVIAAELLVLVALALAGFIYEQRARSGDAAQFRPPGKLVDVGGYKLHLYCTGSGGPTVVLEHGHRATYLDWFRVQGELAKSMRVCSYDRAGHGWSEASPKPRVPSVMAEELHALLTAAGEKPPYILVGHSFGGFDALMFAHKFPADVAGVVLVDSPHPDSFRPASWRSRLRLRFMQFVMPFGLPRWRGWCDGGPQEILAVKRALVCRPRTIQTILREDAAIPTSIAEARGITSLGSVPLVVISHDPAKGRNSALEVLHARQQREFANLSSNSKLIVALGSGHDIPLARPDVVVEAVKSLKPQAQLGSRRTP